MTLREIMERYKVKKLSGCYALYDRDRRIYTDYCGSMQYPFIGCVKNKGKNLVFVYQGLDKPDVRFNSIAELNDLIDDYVYVCHTYGVTTDCFDKTINNVCRCKLAFTQFIKNNTSLQFDKNHRLAVFIGTTLISAEEEESSCCVCVRFEENSCVMRLFDEPLEVLSYIKPIIRALLLTNASKQIINIARLEATTSIEDRYDLHEESTVFKMDLSALSLRKIDSLKHHIITKLENTLQQLKQ